MQGEQEPHSHIDLLAEFKYNADLFDLIGLALYLDEIFQRPVDITQKTPSEQSCEKLFCNSSLPYERLKH